MNAANSICEVSREGSQGPGRPRWSCPVCGSPLTQSLRAHYCSRACQQRAYRLRREPAPDQLVAGFTAELKTRGALIEQTVYECPQCEERFLGERRCENCNLWCRKLGLGGVCVHCEDIVLVTELLGLAS